MLLSGFPPHYESQQGFLLRQHQAGRGEGGKWEQDDEFASFFLYLQAIQLSWTCDW